MKSNAHSHNDGQENKHNRDGQVHRGKREMKDDSRDDANTGDWDDFRDQTLTKDGQYNTNTNYNTGGAGSTGRAETNS
jgi:hypothetical protein